jgi:site-specific recombinase XerD
MSTTELVPSYLDVTKLAVGSFLARYREPTLTAYTQDLRAFLGWCQTRDREPLRVTRGELEMYVRNLESRGYAAATVARRFGTVATFYKYARHRRPHPGQPGGRSHPAEGGLGGPEAHRAPSPRVRRAARRRPRLRTQ